MAHVMAKVSSYQLKVQALFIVYKLAHHSPANGYQRSWGLRFILAFLSMAGLRSAGLIPVAWLDPLDEAAGLLTLVAIPTFYEILDENRHRLLGLAGRIFRRSGRPAGSLNPESKS